MLTAAVTALQQKLPEDTEFHVFSLYPSRDRILKQPEVSVVPARALSLALVLNPLSLIYSLASRLGPVRRLLCRYRPLKVLARSDLLLDLSGISFVDGRTATLAYNAACILPALLVRTPVFKLSQALGPFRSTVNRTVAKPLLKRIKRIYARGANTAQNLEELGLSNWKPAADLAFLLPCFDPDRSEEELTIGVAPSEVMRRYCSRKGFDYISVLYGCLNRMIESNDNLTLVILAHSNLGPEVSSRNNDYQVCKELYRKLPPGRTRLLLDDLGPEELRREIGRCSILIASRFHSMISALCTCTPVLVTAWSHKYREVLEVFGCEEYILDLEDMTATALENRLLKLIRNRRTISGTIRSALPEVRSSARKQILDVADSLNRPRLTDTPKPGRTARRLYRRFYSDSFERAYLGLARSPEIRAQAASGGLVTSLLIDRLESGASSGAVVARLEMGSQGPVPQSFLAKSAEELAECAGSIYSDFDHIRGTLHIISESEGILDIVALPCQITAIRRMAEKDESLRSRIGLLVGLWCGHATQSKLLEDILDIWEVDPKDLKTFRYRKGHWRGRSTAEMKDGTVIERSFSRNYGLYQNLYVDCMRRCFSCTDHFAESADLSAGDCWIGSEKRSRTKKTMALEITPKGGEALHRLIESGRCDIKEIPPELAVRAQKRAVIWHTYSCAARARIGGMFGVDTRCGLDISPRLHDYVSAAMILTSYRLFSGPLRPLMMRMPWWTLYPCMALQKLMLNT